MPTKNKTEKLLEGILKDLDTLVAENLKMLQELHEGNDTAKKGNKKGGGGGGGDAAAKNVNVTFTGETSNTVALLSGLGVFGTKDGGKNVIEVLLSLNKLKLDDKKIEKAKNAILSLAEGLSKIKISKANADGIVGIAKVIETFKTLKVKTLMAIWLAGKMLNKKTGANIAGFIKALLTPLQKYDTSAVKAASEIIKGIGKMILYITAAIALMTILVALDLKKTLIGTGIVVGIIVVLLGLSLLIALIPGKFLAKGIDGIKHIALATLYVSLAIGIMAILLTLFDVGTILAGTGIVVGIIAIILGLIQGLASKDKKTLANASDAIKAIYKFLLWTVVAIGLIAVLIKIFDVSTILIGAGIVVGIVLTLVGLAFILAKCDAKQLQESRKIINALMRIVLVVSLLALFAFVPIATMDGVLVGAAIVLGIILVLELLALGLYWAVNAIGGELGAGDIAMLIGVLTGVVLIISLLALFAFPAIAANAGQVLIGGAVVLGIVLVLELLAVGLYYMIKKIGGDKGIKEVCILLAVLVGVILAISLIASFILVPLGEVWDKAALGAIVVLGIVGIMELLVLGMIKIQKHIGDNKEFLKLWLMFLGITLVILAISLITKFLLVPIGQEWAAAAAGAIVVLGVIGVMELLVLGMIKIQEHIQDNKQLAQLGLMFLGLIVILGLVGLIVYYILTPIGEKWKEAAAGSLVVLGVIGFLELLAWGMLKITEDLEYEQMLKAALVLGGMILALFVVAEITQHILVPIGTEALDALKGGAIVVGVIGFLELLAWTLLKIIENVTYNEMLKAALVLGGMILALYAVAEITYNILIPIGTNAGDALKGGAIVVGLIGIMSLIIVGIGKLASIVGVLDVLLGALVIAAAGAIFWLLGVLMPPFIKLCITAGENAGNTLIGAGILILLIIIMLAMVTVIGAFIIASLGILPILLLSGAAVIVGLGLIFGALGLTMKPFIDLAILAGENAEAVLKGSGILTLLLVGMLAIVGAIGAFIVATLGFGAVILVSGAAVIVSLGGVFHELGVLMPPFIDLCLRCGPQGKEIQLGADIINALLEKMLDTVKGIGNFIVCTLGFGAAIIASGVGVVHSLGLIFFELGILMPSFIDLALKVGPQGNEIRLGSEVIIEIINKFTDLAKSLGKMVGIPFFGDNSLTKGLFVLSQLATVIKYVAAAMEEYFKMLKTADGVDLNRFKPEDIIAIIDSWYQMAEGVGKMMDNKGVMAAIYKGNTIILSLKPFMEALTIIMSAFVETLDAFSGVDIGAATALTKWIAGKNGFCDSVNKMLESLTKVAEITPKQIKRIREGIQPLFETLRNFFEIIELYSTLKYPVAWDNEGKPIEYKKMTDTMFYAAATNIANSFSYFLDKLGPSLENFPKAAAKAIEKMKDSFEPIMNAVKIFMDTVIMVASAKIPILWNAEGKPIYYDDLDNKKIAAAANLVANSFATFIDTLKPHLTLLNEKSVDCIEQMKGGIEPLLNAVHQYSDAILCFVKGYDVEITDSKGQTVKKHMEIKADDYKAAGEVITDAFMNFLDTVLSLTENGKYAAIVTREVTDAVLDELNDGDDKVHKEVTKSVREWSVTGKILMFLQSMADIDKLISAVLVLGNNIVQMLVKMRSDGVTPEKLKVGATDIATAFSNFVDALLEKKSLLNEEDAKNLTKSLSTISGKAGSNTVMGKFQDIINLLVSIVNNELAVSKALEIFTTIGQVLSADTTKSNYETAKTIIVDTIMPALAEFQNVLAFFATGKIGNATVNLNDAVKFGKDITAMINSFTECIINYTAVQGKDVSTTLISNLAKALIDSYTKLNTGFGNFNRSYTGQVQRFEVIIRNYYIKPVNLAIEANKKLADTFKDVDKALLLKEKERTAALRKFAEQMDLIGKNLEYVSVLLKSLDGRETLIDAIENKLKSLKTQTETLQSALTTVASDPNFGYINVQSGTTADSIREGLSSMQLSKTNTGGYMFVTTA